MGVNSLLGRTLPLPCASQRYRHLPVVVPRWGSRQSIRQSYWDGHCRYAHPLRFITFNIFIRDQQVGDGTPCKCSSAFENTGANK